MTEPTSEIQQLITAIHAQTKAMSELAESNRLLVDYLIQDQEVNAEHGSTASYLDPADED